LPECSPPLEYILTLSLSLVASLTNASSSRIKGYGYMYNYYCSVITILQGIVCSFVFLAIYCYQVL
jgi:hypothetical protein